MDRGFAEFGDLALDGLALSLSRQSKPELFGFQLWLLEDGGKRRPLTSEVPLSMGIPPGPGKTALVVLQQTPEADVVRAGPIQ